MSIQAFFFRNECLLFHVNFVTMVYKVDIEKGTINQSVRRYSKLAIFYLDNAQEICCIIKDLYDNVLLLFQIILGHENSKPSVTQV